MGWLSSSEVRGIVVTVAVAVAVWFAPVESRVAAAAGLFGGLATGIGLRRYDSPVRSGLVVGALGAVPYAAVLCWRLRGTLAANPLAVAESAAVIASVAVIGALPVGGVLGAWLGKRVTDTPEPPTPSEAD